MAELVFFSGTMDCGKSTLALQMDHNHRARGRGGVRFSCNDRAGDSRISSRLGLQTDAVEVVGDTDFWDEVVARRTNGLRVDYLICDEPSSTRPPRWSNWRGLWMRWRWTSLRSASLPTSGPDCSLARSAHRTRRQSAGPAGRSLVLVRPPGNAERPHRKRHHGGGGRPGDGGRRCPRKTAATKPGPRRVHPPGVRPQKQVLLTQWATRRCAAGTT